MSVHGSSPAPKRYRQLDRDLEQAEFDLSDSDVAGGWGKWIASLGDVRRAQFFVLPENIIRYEVASSEGGLLRYRVGTWRQQWENGRLVEFTPLEEHVVSASEPWFHDVTGRRYENSGRMQ